MKTIFFIPAVIALFFSTSVSGQKIPMLTEDSIVSLSRNLPDSGTVVINFWATWCGPCVHEMPYFVQADSMLREENVTFIFVSFDPGAKTKQVEKFIDKNRIPGTHFMIGNFNLSEFIDKIDPKWEGGIPYTMVLTKEGRRNHEGAFDNFRDLWWFIRE